VLLVILALKDWRIRSGAIVFENLEQGSDEPVHPYVSRDEQLIAATAVASGGRELIGDWPWLPGNG